MVLYAPGVGDIIRPQDDAQICRSWWPVPAKKDYIVASLSCLRPSPPERRLSFQAMTAINDELCWNPKYLRNLLYKCVHRSSDRSDVLHEIIRRSKTHHGDHVDLKDPLVKYFREGALILGKKIALRISTLPSYRDE